MKLKKLLLYAGVLASFGYGLDSKHIESNSDSVIERNAKQPSIEEIGGFSAPESVYIAKNAIFVSNIGAKPAPLEKDNDGFISRLNTQGKIENLHFITGLHAPKGMAMVGEILYVADIDRVLGFHAQSGRQVFALDVAGAQFLNDIVALEGGRLLVSDTQSGAIYELDTRKKHASVWLRLDSSLAGGNGMLLDSKRNALFVVTYDPSGKHKGSVLCVGLHDKRVEVLVPKLGDLDGIAWARNGDLLVSDWGENLQGVVYRLSLLDSKRGDNEDLAEDLARGGLEAGAIKDSGLKAGATNDRGDLAGDLTRGDNGDLASACLDSGELAVERVEGLPVLQGGADMMSVNTPSGGFLYIPQMLKNSLLKVPLP